MVQSFLRFYSVSPSLFMFSAFAMTSIPYLLVGTRLLSRVRVGPFQFTSQLVVALTGICTFWGICSFPLLLVFSTSCSTPDSFSSPTPVLVELISTTGGESLLRNRMPFRGHIEFSSLLSSLVAIHFHWN